MKTLITTLATITASALVYNVNAQSLEEGKKLFGYERYVSAEKMLQPLAASSPEANFYYGKSLLAQKKVAEAKAAFAKYGDDYMNKTGLASVLFANKKDAEAMAILQDIVDGAKKRDWEKLKFAADAITYSDNATQFDKAIEWYQSAKEKSKDDPNVLLGLADVLIRKNTGTSNGDAVELLTQLGKDSKLASLAYARQGHLWMRAINYPEALASYNKAKEADPQNPLPYEDLANAYYKSGTYNLAKENIEQYLKYSDKAPADQMRYGNILYYTKDYPAAAKIYQSLITEGMGKDYPSLYRGLAYSQYQNGDIETAYKNFGTYKTNMMATQQLTYEDYLTFGQISAAMAEKDSANSASYLKSSEENFTTALDTFNKGERTIEAKTKFYHQVIDAYKDAKEYGKVAEWYKKLIAIDPEASPTDYFNAGFYSYFNKDYAGAKESFEAFNKKYPEENLGYFWIARTKAAQDPDGKTGVAAEAFKTWLGRPDKEGEERKEEDLMFAYQYLAINAYQTADAKSAVMWSNKILALDSKNSTAIQIVNYYKDKK